MDTDVAHVRGQARTRTQLTLIPEKELHWLFLVYSADALVQGTRGEVACTHVKGKTFDSEITA